MDDQALYARSTVCAEEETSSQPPGGIMMFPDGIDWLNDVDLHDFDNAATGMEDFLANDMPVI